MMNESFIHPNAIVESDLVGQGTKIWAFTHVMKDVEIGDNCNIGEHCFFESGVIVGSNTTIKNGNMLWNGVVLEEGVFIGPNATILNDRYPPSRDSEKWEYVTIEEGAVIGGGVTILPGVRVGPHAVVAAGAVLTKDIPTGEVWAGNPAKYHMQRSEYEEARG